MAIKPTAHLFLERAVELIGHPPAPPLELIGSPCYFPQILNLQYFTNCSESFLFSGWKFSVGVLTISARPHFNVLCSKENSSSFATEAPHLWCHFCKSPLHYLQCLDITSAVFHFFQTLGSNQCFTKMSLTSFDHALCLSICSAQNSTLWQKYRVNNPPWHIYPTES